MDTKDLATARIILDQMGGVGKLRAMVSAYDFVVLNNAVQFRFKGCRKANTCRITLNYQDLYCFELFKIGKDLMLKPIFEADGLFWDNLKPTFEKETGLYLSLS